MKSIQTFEHTEIYEIEPMIFINMHDIQIYRKIKLEETYSHGKETKIVYSLIIILLIFGVRADAGN